MSARNCQLCGKPLSRIWVGSGGDFCSREHRNQYRLRQGMDRLQEANKVASVMRRREHLRPLSGTRLASASSVARRGFFRARLTASNKLMLPRLNLAALAAPLRITTASQQFVSAPPARAAGAAKPKA